MSVYAFLSGAVTMGFFTAALFFLRFWRATHDGLFAAFAAAFALLGINQALLILTDMQDEERTWLYLLRLAAFLIIILAVLHKNRAAR